MQRSVSIHVYERLSAFPMKQNIHDNLSERRFRWRYEHL